MSIYFVILYAKSLQGDIEIHYFNLLNRFLSNLKLYIKIILAIGICSKDELATNLRRTLLR